VWCCAAGAVLWGPVLQARVMFCMVFSYASSVPFPLVGVAFLCFRTLGVRGTYPVIAGLDVCTLRDIVVVGRFGIMTHGG